MYSNYSVSSFFPAATGVKTTNFGGVPAASGVLTPGLGIDAYVPGRLNEVGARFGGAIMAANGSVALDCAMLLLGPGVAGEAGIVGGGPMGFTRSSGLSPGKTQTFLFSS